VSPTSREAAGEGGEERQDEGAPEGQNLEGEGLGDEEHGHLEEGERRGGLRREARRGHGHGKGQQAGQREDEKGTSRLARSEAAPIADSASGTSC
jgi:hypothetical protein